VRNAGSHLHKALRVSQPVAHIIDALAVMQPGPKERKHPPQYPIYFRVDPPGLENLPWEALCTSQGTFLTLDDQGATSLWPIGRLPANARYQGEAERTIGSEPKVSLVIAAAQIPIDAQRAEFDAVWGALRQRKGSLQLLASDPALIEHARATADAARAGPSLSTGYVAGGPEMLDDIEAFQPNMVHLFCHGKGNDRPHLELETRLDRRLGKETGEIILDANGLVRLSTCDSVWLVALNCCEGARTLSGSARSVAHDLAAAGVPAVLAMREAIRVEDAHRFSGAFYSALAGELAPLFGRQPSALKKGKTFPMEDTLWARAVRVGRQALARAAADRAAQGNGPSVAADPAGACAEWTLPVLYLHRGGLNLIPSQMRELDAEESVALRSELETLQKAREVLKDVPHDKLQGLEDRIREIEDALYVSKSRRRPPAVTDDV
jgi:hypothetical protein